MDPLLYSSVERGADGELRAIEYTRSPLLLSSRLRATAGEKIVDGVFNTSAKQGYWFRADTYTLSGGNVASLRNRRGTDSLSVTGTVAAPAADPSMGGAQTLTLTGTQRADSNASATSFKFLHDGTGGEWWHVFVPTSNASADYCLHATFNIFSGTTQAGSYAQVGGGTGNPKNQYCILSNGTTSPANGRIIDNAVAGISQNQPGYYYGAIGNYTGPNTCLLATSATAASIPTLAGTPSLASPGNPLRLWQNGAGGLPFVGRWAESLFFPFVLAEYQRQLVREYIAARYGIAAPYVSELDKSVLAQNPFSWLRADYRSESGGKVTAFGDRARPGHSMSQATSGSQVSSVVTDAGFNGREIARFLAGQSYVSTLPASSWGFLHQNCHQLHVFKVRSSGTYVLCGTVNSVSSQNGFQLFLLPNASAQVGAGNAVLSPGVSVTVGTPTYAEFQLSASAYSLRTRAGQASGTPGALSSGAPVATLRLGGQGSGGFAVDADWADSLFFTSQAPRELLLNYLSTRYAM